jgi:hypothetical protein
MIYYSSIAILNKYLLTIAQLWNQPRCPKHKCTAIKKNEILSLEENKWKWRSAFCIRLSQAQKEDNYCIFSLIWGI